MSVTIDDRPPGEASTVIKWNRQLILIAAVMIAVVIAGTGDVIYETVIGKRVSQAQVRALAEKLELGMTQPEVWQISRRTEFDKLVLYEDKDAWVIRAPMVLGAQEWIIVITFESGRVSGIGIRSGDSIRIRPEGAPEDKGQVVVRGQPV